MNIELLHTFEQFAENVSAQDLSKGIRRMLMTTLITYNELGMHSDLNTSFLKDLESLFDLMDNINDQQANNNLVVIDTI